MRSIALDAARGLVIVGVVFNHTVDGLGGAGMINADSAIGRVNAALYMFRMPALVLLVGLFIPSGVARRGAGGYLRGRVVLLAYLYLLWQILQGAIELATSSVRNGSTTVGDVLSIWSPIAHLWFLPFLAVATVMVVGWLQSGPWMRVLTGMLIATIGVIAWGSDFNVAGIRGIALVVFLLAGASIGLKRVTAALATPLWRWVLAGAGGIAIFVALLPLGVRPATVPTTPDLVANLLSIAAATAGIVTVLALAAVVARIPVLGRSLAALGQVTLPVYLAHIAVVAGGRIALTAAGVDEPEVLLLLLVPLGVGVPVLLHRVVRPLRLRWLFELPLPLARLASVRSARDRASDSPSPARATSDTPTAS